MKIIVTRNRVVSICVNEAIPIRASPKKLWGALIEFVRNRRGIAARRRTNPSRLACLSAAMYPIAYHPGAASAMTAAIPLSGLKSANLLKRKGIIAARAMGRKISSSIAGTPHHTTNPENN